MTPSPVAVATLLAPILRQLIHRIEARTDWTPEQKRWIPWVCVGLGAIVAAASLFAGLPIDDAVVLGMVGPGAVVANELIGARKPPVPPAALVLVALALGGCANEAAGVAVFAIGIVGGAVLLLQSLSRYRARRIEDASDARAICAGCGALRYSTPSVRADGVVIHCPADRCAACGVGALSDEHARAIEYALGEKRRRSGAPVALAVALLALSGCHLSHGTRAGLAFVAAVPTIEEGIKVYRAQRPQFERQVGIDARAACAGQPNAAAYNDCTEAIAQPRWKALDDVRLSVGTYEAAVSAAASGLDNDLPAAASKVIAALASIGIRVAQEVK